MNSEERRRSSPPLSVGRVLDEKFEIQSILGEGGTGIVYAARRVSDDNDVALKVIHPHLVGDEQIRGRFTREAAILRRLQGKHISGVLEFGEVADPRRDGATILYMALPKIDGPALDELVAQEGPLPIDRALDIVKEVCDGLSAAHAQGVIHRDLKPPNVLLRGRKHAIVVDFGLAKIITGGGGTGTTALTQHNMLFGTPEYMAPEQARGDELDARCDIYAVGVILYQLLTGEVPFTGATPLTILTAHLTMPPVPPRIKSPDRGISRALDAVVMHMLAKSPADRYPTAAAVSAAIAHARALPDDTEGVKPHPTISVEDNADGHAATIPSPIPSEAPARLVKVSGSQPVPSSSPPPRSGPPERNTPPPRLTPTVATLAAASASAASARWRQKAGWVLVWLLFASVGIAIGVYLSLRSS
ncbi:MAG: serine/threonine protein kinase [Myxococcaceae bacterium]|nr:serine/threonine protein kinase [Myxococcaceae bacterium]